MKIDMMESLGYSFLRHVQGCWIVQTNWKWPGRGAPGRQGQVAEEFEEMREKFGLDVFKKTKDVEGLLKHAELDALGVTRNGDVHALEAAFHQGGLQYGETIDDTFRIVRKKMLRTYLVLKDLGFCEARQHVWFLSPRVRGQRAEKLEELFKELERTYQFPEADGLHRIRDRIAVGPRTHQETAVRRQGLRGQMKALGGPGDATPLGLHGPALAAREIQHQAHLRTSSDAGAASAAPVGRLAENRHYWDRANPRRGARTFRRTLRAAFVVGANEACSASSCPCFLARVFRSSSVPGTPGRSMSAWNGLSGRGVARTVRPCSRAAATTIASQP